MSCSCGCGDCGAPADVLTRCQCCAGTGFETPVAIDNPPALASLAWRVGTQGRFEASMQAGIRSRPSLGALGTRRDDDWTLGLVDAWASALDVLGFHQERYGQELYLRTADERRSLLELGRLIGYQLGPGVAARVSLAFGMAAGPGVPQRVTIEAGTPASSLPQAADELPQTFETRHPLVADVRFGEMHPRRAAEPSLPALEQKSFWLAGVTTGLEEGDPLLLVASLEPGQQRLLRVRSVEPRAAENRTLVRCSAAVPAAFVEIDPALPGLRQSLEEGGSAPGFLDGHELLQWLEYLEDWGIDQLIAWIEVWKESEAAFDPTFTGPGLFALDTSTRIFGHNAPRRAMLSAESREVFEADWDPKGWSYPIYVSPLDNQNKGCIHLDRAVPELRPASWLVLEGPGVGASQVWRVQTAAEESVADYGISGPGHRVVLMGSDATPTDHWGVGFGLRRTTVHAASRRLELAPMPIRTLPAGTADLLLEEVVPHLEPGRTLIVEGERLDQPGILAREEVVVKGVQQGKSTWLLLESGLQHGYLQQTVVLYGNVAEATHGETVVVALGSGDASQAHQSFRLPRNPLTYTAAAVPGGAEANLEIRVDGVRWREVPSLYPAGACDRVYALRRDDSGRTRVVFGDGERGARLPTGAENVVAYFRVGLGRAGLVAPGQISLLPKAPLGVRQVTNPLASVDADDPETRDEARRAAPMTVRTLDRAVSLHDYRDFALAYAGVDEARADRVWDGRRRVIFLSIAGVDGATPSSALLGELRTALDRGRDGRPPVRLGAYAPVRFAIDARLGVGDDYPYDDVLRAARQALGAHFAFGRRRLGQSVRSAEVMAVLHALDGIEAVDVDALEPVLGTAQEDAHGLQARPARWVDDGTAPGRIEPATLLYLAESWAEPLRLRRL